MPSHVHVRFQSNCPSMSWLLACKRDWDGFKKAVNDGLGQGRLAFAAPLD
jgi:hypothetical protein